MQQRGVYVRSGTRCTSGLWPSTSAFFFLIYFSLAVLDLRCCARAFSSCGEWGLLFVAVRGLLVALASPDAEHGL